LESAANDLLGGGDADMADATRHIAFLRDLEMTSRIDSAVVLDWLGPEVGESNRRAPACGASLFGRLKQLHNTPCRVLALVGMQNDNFPAQTATPSWDLLRAKPKIWDRNARVDDRQMFVDSILAPSGRLIITASTLNIRTNKSQPLSTCVEELLNAAASLGATRETLVRKHPLQPFSVKYFSAGKLPKPIGSGAARLAQRVHSGERTPAPLHVPAEIPTAKESRTDISLEELIAFWKDPAKAFLKARHIAVPFEEADDKDLDLAPLSVDSLESWIIKDAILREHLSASGNLNLLKNRLRADRTLPPGEFGEKIWESHCAASQPIAEKLAFILGESLPLVLEIGSCRIHGEVFQHRDKSALVSFRAGEIKHPEHFLAPWITANLAAAANHSLPTLLVDESLAGPPVMKAAITQGAGRAMIEILLQGFLEGRERPLCYAPKTSQKLSAGLDKAKNEWNREDIGYGGGEGLKESSKLAWRDRNPFLKNTESEKTDWEKWGTSVAQPLEQW
jgi:exodeoxyribonuclease V gamma subunit